jgi:hypothetical protein
VREGLKSIKKKGKDRKGRKIPMRPGIWVGQGKKEYMMENDKYRYIRKRTRESFELETDCEAQTDEFKIKLRI